MASKTLYLSSLLLVLSLATIAFSDPLKPDFYDKICPKACRRLDVSWRRPCKNTAAWEPLCFVCIFTIVSLPYGCDASILLDSTRDFTSEKFVAPNNNSVKGYEVIDRIKWEVDRVCGHLVVSCADILAVAARDSVVVLGGPHWNVQLGRRDSSSASINRANVDLPSPFSNLPDLIKAFKKQGLNEKDLVALSGAHTLGFAQCVTFRARAHNDKNIDSGFAITRQATCPLHGGNSNLAPFDATFANFDTKYFENLLMRRVLLHSDQELFSGGETDGLVRTYSSNPNAFARDFATSMIKMGNIKPLTGEQGQIRKNCRRVN